MTVSINGRYSHDYRNGVLVRETLNPANETVDRGHYVATTLSAVDADLAAGNIKEAVNIFGFLGTFAGGPLAEDVLGSQGGYGVVNNAGFYGAGFGVPEAGDLDVNTVTKTFAANSMAVGVAYIKCNAFAINTLKLRLYMDAVQVAESAYFPTTDLALIAVGTRALSGVKIVKASVHNYGTAANGYFYGASYVTPGKAATGVAVGSIKL